MDSDSEASQNSSNTSRSASPAQPSPSTSFHAEPSLQQLTTHFVNAKRSLSTTHHVFRANELVTASRALVEETAMLNARNEYAGREAEDGVRLLEDVKGHIEKKGGDTQAEFSAVLEGLDEANGRLMSTLETLGRTVVDASLRRQVSTAKSTQETDGERGEDDAEEKTLVTFIDTTKHETAQAAVKAQIDNFHAASDDLSASIDKFSSHIEVLHSMLSPPPSDPEPPETLRPTLFDEPPPTISQLFHSITDNASTMASLLQSLISHYDLCVAALRHTEGGGEAARRAVQQHQRSGSPSDSTDLPKGKSNLEESLYRKDHAAPISGEEKTEMLKVLFQDSEQVDDVVAELSEHARDLEGAFDRLAAHARKGRERDKTLRKVVGMLHEMRDIHLPSHLHALQTFSQDWQRIRSAIDEGTAQLVSLSAFYNDFYESYSKLLREVDRRAATEAQMKRIAEKAAKEITRLREKDREAREGFMREVEDFLPGDLWPALRVEGRRWEVVEMGPEDEEVGEGVDLEVGGSEEHARDE